MKVSIMQPYFFPYLGYWQMFNLVDKFVILDDVNYIKRGYINSNYILINGSAHKFTIPLDKPSQNKLINETKMKFSENEKQSFLKMIRMAYSRAPYFDDTFLLLEKIIRQSTLDLTEFIFNSFVEVKEYLGLSTEILISSQINKDNSLRAEDRIIEINKRLGSDIYINAIGGQKLYDYEHFKKESIELNFIQMIPCKYTQFNNEFVPNLSFIDVLMFNCKEMVLEMLDKYELISRNDCRSSAEQEGLNI